MSFMDTVSEDAQRRLLITFCRNPSFRKALCLADPVAFYDLLETANTTLQSKEYIS